MKGETHISTIIFGHSNHTLASAIDTRQEIGKNIDYFYAIFEHDGKQRTKKIYPVCQNGLYMCQFIPPTPLPCRHAILLLEGQWVHLLLLKVSNLGTSSPHHGGPVATASSRALRIQSLRCTRIPEPIVPPPPRGFWESRKAHVVLTREGS